MSFWIKQIRIWSIHKNIKPVTYDFKLNKVNVITGDSTTGKTSILAIIDYCLGAEKNNIPDGIFEFSSFFGITIVIDGEVISITRKSPHSNQVVDELYVNEGELLENPLLENKLKLDKFLVFFNEKVQVNKELLNKISREQKGGKMRASFRSFLIFNSLTEDIIGSKFDYLDYKFYEHNLSNVSSTLFKYAIVENSSQYAKLENDLNEISKIEKKKERLNQSEKSIALELKSIFNEFGTDGFLDREQSFLDLNENLDFLVDLTSYKKIEIVKDDVIGYLNSLQEKKKEVLFKLGVFENYKKEVERYNQSLETSIQDLQPIKFLKEKLLDNFIDSPETFLFLNELDKSLNKIKVAKRNIQEMDDFTEEKNLLKEELRHINSEIYKTKEELDSMIDLKNIYNKGIIREKVETLKSKYEKSMTNKFGSSQVNKSEIRFSEIQTKDDYNYISEEEIKRGENKLLVFNEIFSRNVHRVSEEIEKIIKEIPSLNSYHRHRVSINIERMIISLIEPKNEFSFPISNLGSKSNYMYLHLSFFLGLHMFLNSFEKSIISRFLFIDQPSIPYFSDASNSKDEKKLVEAFALLDTFIKTSTTLGSKEFQIILVEHASKELWESNRLTSFHLVKQFTNGEGLLPNNFF